MKRFAFDRWFVWTVAGILVAGIGLWAHIQYTIIELDAQAAELEAAHQPISH